MAYIIKSSMFDPSYSDHKAVEERYIQKVVMDRENAKEICENNCIDHCQSLNKSRSTKDFRWDEGKSWERFDYVVRFDGEDGCETVKGLTIINVEEN